MRIISSIALTVVVLMLSGCARKLTFERFQTIHVGQPKDGVLATLGEPLEDTGRTLVYYDPDRRINAAVYFDEKSQVTGMEWNDPRHGDHGCDPEVTEPGDETSIKVQKVE